MFIVHPLSYLIDDMKKFFVRLKFLAATEMPESRIRTAERNVAGKPIKLRRDNCCSQFNCNKIQ